MTGTNSSDKKSEIEAKRQERIRQATRYADETKNPCLKESEMSMKCMSDNGYDKDKCSLHFQNYRNCQDFWDRVKRDRKRQGIQPDLPPPEQREHAKLAYMFKWTGN